MWRHLVGACDVCGEPAGLFRTRHTACRLREKARRRTPTPTRPATPSTQAEAAPPLTEADFIGDRLSMMAYFNEARRVSYVAAGDFVRGVKFVPLVDSFTTPFCRALERRSIARTDPLFSALAPPFHAEPEPCRTTVVPVLATDTAHRFDDDWQEWLRANPPPVPLDRLLRGTLDPEARRARQRARK